MSSQSNANPSGEATKMPVNGVQDVFAAAAPILDLLHKVESGETKGSAGSYYADGKGTLADIHVPVEMLRRLRAAIERIPKV